MFLDEGCFPLSFMERSKRHKHANTTKKEFVFGPEQPQPYRKTILLIGPKGSGKTALVNSFANFVNNVTATAPYRLHITPVNEKANSNSSMNYAPTHSVSTYVFQNTPLGFPIALVDTPSIGVVEEQSPSVEHIKAWIENDYQRPIEDLEIWFVISAVDSDFSSEAEEDLQVVLDAVEWKARVIPVITFAKKRKPILAQRELTRLGFRCEHEGVDYFTINNGSILGLSTELLEINAVPYDIGMENLRSLVLSHREPELMPLHISTNEGSRKFSTVSTDSDQSNETLSTPSTSPVKVVNYEESSEVDRSTPLNTPEPVYEAPQPILSAHKRFKSCDSEKASLVKKREVVAPLQKEKMRSTDCIVDEKKTLPSYEKFLKEIRKDKSKIDPLKRCQSEDGLESDIVRRKFGFMAKAKIKKFNGKGEMSRMTARRVNGTKKAANGKNSIEAKRKISKNKGIKDHEMDHMKSSTIDFLRDSLDLTGHDVIDTVAPLNKRMNEISTAARKTAVKIKAERLTIMKSIDDLSIYLELDDDEYDNGTTYSLQTSKRLRTGLFKICSGREKPLWMSMPASDRTYRKLTHHVSSNIMQLIERFDIHKLKLDYMFIDEHVLTFIRSRAPSFKTIKLNNCTFESVERFHSMLRECNEMSLDMAITQHETVSDHFLEQFTQNVLLSAIALAECNKGRSFANSKDKNFLKVHLSVDRLRHMDLNEILNSIKSRLQMNMRSREMRSTDISTILNSKLKDESNDDYARRKKIHSITFEAAGKTVKITAEFYSVMYSRKHMGPKRREGILNFKAEFFIK